LTENPDGLDYMLARYYSSSLGRFMEVEPGDDTRVENPQSWNKYSLKLGKKRANEVVDERRSQWENALKIMGSI